MNLNMQSVRSYLGQAAQTAKELSSQAAVAAKDLSSQVTGAKCLRDYNMQSMTGSAGPGCLWKIFAARSKNEGKAFAHTACDISHVSAELDCSY